MTITRALPHTPQTKVELPRFPRVLMTPQVFEDMHFIVDATSEEVGWLGTVERVGDGPFADFLITEVFVLKQQAHGTTCEITTEGLAEFSEVLLQQPDGLDKLNRLRFWGHSHPQFDTAPSQQDNIQFASLSKDCDDFFVRGIMNKKGKLEFSVALLDIGVTIRDVTWGVTNTFDDTRRDMWVAEVRDKVSRFGYVAPGNFGGWGGGAYGNTARGTYEGGSWNEEDWRGERGQFQGPVPTTSEIALKRAEEIAAERATGARVDSFTPIVRTAAEPVGSPAGGVREVRSSSGAATVPQFGWGPGRGGAKHKKKGRVVAYTTP